MVVNSSATGKVNAFFDWNNDGDFADAGEVIAELSVAAGVNNLSVPVPLGAVTGANLGRFRLSTAGGLTALGAAPDGEVEDYQVSVQALDFGDLPDTGAGTGAGNYQTLLSDNGPRHTVTTLKLGAAVDSEANGQPNGTATGDDVAGVPDDEDGVTYPDVDGGPDGDGGGEQLGDGQGECVFRLEQRRRLRRCGRGDRRAVGGGGEQQPERAGAARCGDRGDSGRGSA